MSDIALIRMPTRYVNSFMAGLSLAAGLSARLYLEQLVCILTERTVIGEN